MANENGEPRCCSQCGGELGDDGFAVRLQEELPVEIEADAAPVVEADTDGAFAAALRRRQTAPPEMNAKVGGV